MSDIKEKLIDQAGSLLDKAYDDALAPTIKPVGAMLSLLPRTVRLCLSKWERWIINGEGSLELTAKAVQKKLEKIPIEKLTEPEPYVAIPAIQQLGYCFDNEELRNMYANLLVSSMNEDTKWKVHPSFVDIIKQLTPDEAKLLKHLSMEESQQPLIDIRLVHICDGSYQLVLQNFTTISKGICDNPSGIFMYLNNFERLKLIEIPFINALSDDKFYRPLEESPEIKAFLNQPVAEGFRYKIMRKEFSLTQFGREFIKICIGLEADQ